MRAFTPPGAALLWGGSGHAPISTRRYSYRYGRWYPTTAEFVYLGPMPRKPGPRKKFLTVGGKVRESVYLSPDEEQALEERAAKVLASKSEIMRRALRKYLGLD